MAGPTLVGAFTWPPASTYEALDVTMKHLRVLSYNIHKGFSTANTDFVLERIKQSIELVHAEIVFLQEVVGQHERYDFAQFEYLADRLWPHYAYGRNSVYAEGHHGNAILSKHPIKLVENIDVSTNRFERRGILHATVSLDDRGPELHLLCLHFDLFENGRK